MLGSYIIRQELPLIQTVYGCTMQRAVRIANNICREYENNIQLVDEFDGEAIGVYSEEEVASLFLREKLESLLN